MPPEEQPPERFVGRMRVQIFSIIELLVILAAQLDVYIDFAFASLLPSPKAREEAQA
jgi:hypothetical protein